MRENFRSKIQFNKQIILRLIVIFLISQILFCASAKEYFIDRGNDLKDIANVGIEKNIYGIKIDFGFDIGYQKASNGVGYGLRHGHWGKYFTGDNDNKILVFDAEEGDEEARNEYEISPGDSNLYISTSYHKPNNLDDRRSSKKQFLLVFPILRWCNSNTKAKYLSFKLDKTPKCMFFQAMMALV